MDNSCVRKTRSMSKRKRIAYSIIITIAIFVTMFLLIRYACLADISITFFNFNDINYRKILINSYYYNFYSNSKKNPVTTKYSPEKTNAKYDNDYKIYFDQIDDISDNENKELLLLRDEAILNELFPYFNYNLNALLIIIENKIKDESNHLSSLYLNFRSRNVGYTNLNIYDNYNSAITCFLYNFLKILEENKNACNLTSLDLLLDDYTGEKEFIIKSLGGFYNEIIIAFGHHLYSVVGSLSRCSSRRLIGGIRYGYAPYHRRVRKVLICISV